MTRYQMGARHMTLYHTYITQIGMEVKYLRFENNIAKKKLHIFSSTENIIFINK